MNLWQRIAKTFIPAITIPALAVVAPPALSSEPAVPTSAPACRYAMCQYEKGTIDTIIVEHARKCQTVMFGEIHDRALASDPPPVNDSQYVGTLLSRLKEAGYGYLALEVNQNAPAGTHSHDIIRFFHAHHKGEECQEELYPQAKPGWICLVAKAMDLGFEICFIDTAPQGPRGSFQRDRAMYKQIQRQIFDHAPNAKLVVYIGANHIGELETDNGITSFTEKRRPLGLFLDAHTGGKNFSVYMGHAYDTPVGVDLFISDFIWNHYPGLNPSPRHPPKRKGKAPRRP